MIEPLEARIAPAPVIAPIMVNTLSDKEITGKTNLADALQQAAMSGAAATIDFATGLKGTIHLATTLSITSDVTINGTGIVLNGGGKVQDLTITGGTNSGIAVTLNGLKIINGKATQGTIGGGVYIDDSGGTVTLSQCVISGNHAVGQKGAAASDGNPATDGDSAQGGGIAIVAGTVTIQNSTISGNSAVGGNGGGGGYNGGRAEGGGIYNSGMLTLMNTRVTGNSAVGGAGIAGIRGVSYSLAAAGPVTPTAGGSGGNAYGGGIANDAGTLVIQATVISGNSIKGGAGGAGGAAYNGTNGVSFHVVPGMYGGPVSPTAGNDGSAGAAGGNGGNAAGGGISSGGGPLTITSSTISGNTAVAGAGASGSNGGKGGNGGSGGRVGSGMYAMTYYGYAGSNGGQGGDAGSAGFAEGGGVFSMTSLTIQVSTVSGNVLKAAPSGHAGHGGAVGAHGGLYQAGSGTPPAAGAPGASPTITPSGGGGIYSGGGTLAMSLVTVAKNSAQQGGGVDVTKDTSATIYNSTIALNTATTAFSAANMSGGGGGLYILPDTANDPVVVISSIITQNKMDNLGGSGTLGMASIDNVTSGLAVATTLKVHGTGTTATLLPLSSLMMFANNSTSNPSMPPLTTDQDGTMLGMNIDPGSVQ
jgi:hypothetical protein